MDRTNLQIILGKLYAVAYSLSKGALDTPLHERPSPQAQKICCQKHRSVSSG